MSWSIGYDQLRKRDVGYGVPAYCDAPGCREEINRGLSYVCGNEPHGGAKGCGLYFCEKHQHGYDQRCPRCAKYKSPYVKWSPDHPRWVLHKLTDESWQRWRDENPDEVESIKNSLIEAATKP